MGKALADTGATPYEHALTKLGLFAGASESLPRSSAHASPDGAWLFGDITWISWEAKSDANPEGQLGAGDTREAGGHLRYVARSREQQPPDDSFGFIIARQLRTHPASALVAEDHLWLIRPEQVLDLHHKIVRAWRLLRSLNVTVTQIAADIVRAEQAMPSQWISDLRITRLANPSDVAG